MRESPRPQSHAQPASSANLKRRRFLLTLGAGGATAAAAAAGTLAAPLAAPDAAPDATAGKGYQETEHVRDYYASARI